MTQHALSPEAILTVLRSELPLSSALAAAGLSADRFAEALTAHLQSKLPQTQGKVPTHVRKGARIRRDERGVPHISADDSHDLHFAWGYAMAQDRLWQMDWLRRAATGRLPEILGPQALPGAVEVATLGIDRIAAETAARLPRETADALGAFCEGINALIAHTRTRPPIEFEILGYECDPWTPTDSIAIMKHFWWQLTGRLFMMTGPEMLRTAVADDTCYHAFLNGEGAPETILPSGANRAAGAGPLVPQSLSELLNLALQAPAKPRTKFRSAAAAEPGTAEPGSNNWAVGPTRSASGSPLFASDPHTPYQAPSIWHEVHLVGSGTHTAGMAYVGMPGIIFGRNLFGSWGITNNICSQRDLFVLPVEQGSGDSYRIASVQHRLHQHTQSIPVRGTAPHTFLRRVGDHGPVVDHLLNPTLAEEKTVALQWVGAEFSDEIGCLLSLQRAQSAEQFRNSLRPWACPTFNFLWADRDGHIAYQTVGKLPIRKTAHRGLRDISDPAQHWQGYFAFEQLPWALDPKQGWIGTANNPILSPAEDPGLGGQWTSDIRGQRLRAWLGSQAPIDFAACVAGQSDCTSERARMAVPALMEVLKDRSEPLVKAALQRWANWDFRIAADSSAAAIWEVFQRRWTHTVYDERLDAETKALVFRQGFGLIYRLVQSDVANWFRGEDRRRSALVRTFKETLLELAELLGPDMDAWHWGRLHTVSFRHPLGRTEILAGLLNTGPHPIDGSNHTLNQQWVDPVGSYETTSGACCRVAVELSKPVLSIVNCLGNSGHVGSPNYRDQVATWLAGKLFDVTLDRKTAESAEPRLELVPG